MVTDNAVEQGIDNEELNSPAVKETSDDKTTASDVKAPVSDDKTEKKEVVEEKTTYTKAELEAQIKEKERILQVAKDKEVLDWKIKHSALEKQIAELSKTQQQKQEEANFTRQQTAEKQKWIDEGVPETTIENIQTRARQVWEAEQKYKDFDSYVAQQTGPINEIAKRNMAFELILEHEVEDGPGLLTKFKDLIEPLMKARSREEMENIVLKRSLAESKDETKEVKRKELTPDSGTKRGGGIDINKLSPKEKIAYGLREEEEERKHKR